MTVKIIDANSTLWNPISSKYPYDENISLKPSEILWRDGFRTIYHPLYEKCKDVSINNDTTFMLSQTGSFFDFFEEISHGQYILGCYVSLSIDDILVRADGGNIIVSDEIYDSNNYFKLIYNENGSISLLHGNKYFTVTSVLPYQIILEDELSVTEIDRQQFQFESFGDRIILKTNFDNIFYPDYGIKKIERFVSYDKYDGFVKAVGMVSDDDYTPNNTMLLGVSGFDIVFDMDGLKNDQYWVKYYNDLIYTKDNNNTNIDMNNSVSGVTVNRLVDSPFKTKVDVESRSMEVNIANLKNTMNSSYEYRKEEN